MSSAFKPSETVTARGGSCEYCRRRRRKCDGARPVCGQCLAGNRIEDCEYTGGQGRSRMQILEDDIARLESRIHELEHPDNNNPPVALYNPYGYSGSRNQNPGGRSGGLPQQSVSWWASQEPPLQMFQPMVDRVLENAAQLGFFLHVPQFRHSALLPFPLGHPERPSPALLSAVALWGIRLSQSPQMLPYEPKFLERALENISTALTTTSGSNSSPAVLQLIQAEILICNYFFSRGRFLEGRYHLTAMASMVISSGLNTVQFETSGVYPSSRFPTKLPPPQNATEHHERVSAFWSAFVLDKSWSAILDFPTHFGPPHQGGVNIDTPWPMDISSFSRESPQVLSQGRTIQRFLSDRTTRTNGYGFSELALRAKASLLLEIASQTGRDWSSNMNQAESQTYLTTFTSINTSIEDFLRSIPAPDWRLAIPREVMIIHSLAHSAVIRLHNPFANTNSLSREKCVISAKIVLQMVVNMPVEFLDVIIGPLWTTACQLAIDEVGRLRQLPPSWTTAGPVMMTREERDLVALLGRTLESLSRFSQYTALMNFLVLRVRAVYVKIQGLQQGPGF